MYAITGIYENENRPNIEILAESENLGELKELAKKIERLMSMVSEAIENRVMQDASDKRPEEIEKLIEEIYESGYSLDLEFKDDGYIYYITSIKIIEYKTTEEIGEE